MTTTTMTTNTAGGIVVVIPPLLPFLRVNDVSQVQANQECQQHMSTTMTMTSVAIAATTLPISPPAVIQPVLSLAPTMDKMISFQVILTCQHPAIYIMNFRYGMVE